MPNLRLSIARWLLVLLVMPSFWVACPANASTPPELQIQANIDHLEVLTPNLEVKTAGFISLALNLSPVHIGDLWYDGFAFRTPATNVEDLRWAFTLPPKEAGLGRWFILPEKGTMEGFSDYTNTNFRNQLLSPTRDRTARTDRTDGDANFTPGISQSLEAKNLLPNTRYMIWFAFTANRPARIRVSLNLISFDLKSLVRKTRSQIRDQWGAPTSSASQEDFYNDFQVLGIEKMRLVFLREYDDVGLEAIDLTPGDRSLDWPDVLRLMGASPEGIRTHVDEEQNTIVLEKVAELPKIWWVAFSSPPSSGMTFGRPFEPVEDDE